MSYSQPVAIDSLLTVNQFHPHHLTLNSPWPILTAGSTLAILTGAVYWFNAINHGGYILVLGIFVTIIAFTLWWRDVITEATYLGHHTRVVQEGLSIGFSLFVLTEAFFFLSIFWAYFHSGLSPTDELAQWPPVAIPALSPVTVPLLNTILLVSSGATVTYGHHALILGNRKAALQGTLATVVLAILFTGAQIYEYIEAGFTIADGAFGTCFFFGTGFHGFHVFIGTAFIAVGLVRISLYHFTATHHLGFESSILYWHFVDVVWLGLYLIFYWWGA